MCIASRSSHLMDTRYLVKVSRCDARTVNELNTLPRQAVSTVRGRYKSAHNYTEEDLHNPWKSGAMTQCRVSLHNCRAR